MAILCVNFADKFFIDLVTNMLDEGMDVSYVISLSPQSQSLIGRTKVLNVEDFSYPSCISKLEIVYPDACLSEEIFRDFLDAQAIFLSISDRFSYIPRSVKMRQRLYRHLLLFWITFLQKNNIDTVIFDATPHMGWDNILYSVAKKQGITTLWVSRTLLQDRVFISTDYQKYEKVPEGFMDGLSVEEINECIQHDIREQLYRESSWIERSKTINQKILRENRSFWTKLRQAPASRIFQAACDQMNPIPKYKKFKSLFMRRFYSPTFFNEVTSEALISTFRSIHSKRMKSLQHYYKSRTSEVNYDRKYIFFALHFQPERSTTPEGGCFEDQYLAIRILSSAIPKDWVIYVKEHPRQFDPKRISVELYRDRQFYEEILKLGNVKLVGLHVSSGELIKRAGAIATITGSVAWEGLVQGIPAICFGVPWYIGCNSCIKVSSLDECREAIDRIARNDSNMVRADLLKFMAWFQSKLIISSNGFEFAKQSQQPYELLIKNACDAIKAHVSLSAGGRQ